MAIFSRHRYAGAQLPDAYGGGFDPSGTMSDVDAMGFGGAIAPPLGPGGTLRTMWKPPRWWPWNAMTVTAPPQFGDSPLTSALGVEEQNKWFSRVYMLLGDHKIGVRIAPSGIGYTPWEAGVNGGPAYTAAYATDLAAPVRNAGDVGHVPWTGAGTGTPLDLEGVIRPGSSGW